MTETEPGEKRRRLLALLEAERLDALVLRRPANIAWYSCGGRTHILATPEVGVADVVIRRDADTVVTAVNEAARLEEEELGALGARFQVLPWQADRRSALPSGPNVGCDAPLADARDVGLLVEAARRRLTPAEVDRYRALGRDAAEAMTAVCLALDPRETEFVAAALLAGELRRRAADPVVLLVAGAERLPRHRHPLPTAAALGRLAMLVVCARRGGLVASLTRFVSFGPLPPHLRDAHARLLGVDAAFIRATVPGAHVGDAFAAGASAYAEHGFDAGEWKLHHQGGPTGYEPRDYLATEASAARIEDGQAFAWNPSVPSLKSEDTIIVRPDGQEIVTADPAWPVAVMDAIARPLILER